MSSHRIVAKDGTVRNQGETYKIIAELSHLPVERLINRKVYLRRVVGMMHPGAACPRVMLYDDPGHEKFLAAADLVRD